MQTPAHSSCLEAVELRAVPVAALRVVADGVARAQTDPVGERAVRLAQVAHKALHTESLVRRHCQKVTNKNTKKNTQKKYNKKQRNKKWVFFLFHSSFYDFKNYESQKDYFK